MLKTVSGGWIRFESVIEQTRRSLIEWAQEKKLDGKRLARLKAEAEETRASVISLAPPAEEANAEERGSGIAGSSARKAKADVQAKSMVEIGNMLADDVVRKKEIEDITGPSFLGQPRWTPCPMVQC